MYINRIYDIIINVGILSSLQIALWSVAHDKWISFSQEFTAHARSPFEMQMFANNYFDDLRPSSD